MKKAFTLFLCILLICLLILSPSFLMQGIHKNVYTLWEQQQQEKYTGNLSLWHIVSFKTGGETGVSYLKSRIRAFEKNNPYVFIDLKAFTIDEALQAMASGDFPDILSFPLGFIGDYSQLCELPEQSALLEPYRNTGRYQGAVYAYPYMVDFYTLNCNQDLFFYEDISLPFDNEFTADALSEFTTQLMQTNIADLSLGNTATSYASASFLFSKKGTLSSDVLHFWQKKEFSDNQAFLDQQTAIILCPASEAKKADAQNLTNSITLKTYAFSDYTDLCQMVGVCSGMEAEKEKMCQAFAASLLSDTAQKNLTNLYMLPTTQQDSLYEDSPFYMQEYIHMSQYACVPNNFALADAWSNNKPEPLIDATQCKDILSIGK